MSRRLSNLEYVAREFEKRLARFERNVIRGRSMPPEVVAEIRLRMQAAFNHLLIELDECSSNYKKQPIVRDDRGLVNNKNQILMPFDTEEAKAFFERHMPVSEAWINELEAAHDPYVASAAHAVFCLLSSFWFADEPHYDWYKFNVHDFLFVDLMEGGTVGMDGPVDVFFDHLCEALRRFAYGGAMPASLAANMVVEMNQFRDEFVSVYTPTITEKTAP